MSRVMYFDCFSGAAGDMVLGALLDAGLPEADLRHALGSLAVGHELHVTKVLRAGITATHIRVSSSHGHEHASHPPSPEASAGQAHSHPHPPHPPHSPHSPHSPHPSHHHDLASHSHRSLAEIAHLIDHSALSAAGKARAVGLFRRLAEAEAAIHSMSVEDVHLHEVGAVDSIIDIVGAVFALEWFGIDDIVSSPLNVGSGTVQMAHGTFPVPAPATVRLLVGVPVYSSGIPAELVTPTGALVISDYARSYGPLPAMTVSRIGYGAGTRNLDPVPNVLRVLVGERAERSIEPEPLTAVVKIECEIDDMNPQLYGPVTEQLVAAGALDVFLTPVYMKKGRPGTLLTVLAPSEKREAICDRVFRETTTLGVRFERVWRETLDRRWVEVHVPGGTVRIKVAGRHGEVLNAIPEFDDCVRIATVTGRSVKSVQADAMRAWSDRDQRPPTAG
jgi:pyridinium-3,5-bisthiocarboxylic acid mononucleotide nickel chelatase